MSGTGTQTLEWKPKQGDWAVVVMNADGSAGVSTQSTFGAKVTFLAEVGLALLAAGLVLLVASVLFVYFALRGRGTAATGGRRRSRDAAVAVREGGHAGCVLALPWPRSTTAATTAATAANSAPTTNAAW